MAKTASPEFIRQRRAVYHGLCSILTEPEAAAALVVWTEHFSAPESAFSGLNSFVRDVSSSFNKVELQRELLHAISRALVTKQEELRQAPPLDGEPMAAPIAPPIVPIEEAIKEPAPVAGNTDGTNDTPEFKSFCALLSGLLALIDQQHAELSQPFREYIKEIINDLPWSEAQQQQLIAFIDSASTQQTRAYRDGQLKALFGPLRIWMENNLDKKTTAGIIERAMTDVGRTDTGRLHSPKAFF